MKYGDLSFGQVEAIVNKLGGMEGVKRFLSGDLVVKSPENGYMVFVDYGQTLQQMIAKGKYDYANSDITSGNFPFTAPSAGGGKREVVVELLHFGRGMASSEVIKEFEARNLRAATLPELLAFGATYPEKQREYPIFAFGSVWQHHNGRHVPYLNAYKFGSLRQLNLNRVVSRWDGFCRFAAVRK